jgi:hypothetical protein
MDLDLNGQNASDKGKRLSGWRDLNSRPLDTPDIGSGSTDVLKRPFSLKTRILHLGVLRWTDPNGGPNGGQTHS